MNFSRIYQYTPTQFVPSGTSQAVTLDAALPGSNEDDAHRKLFDSLRAVFHTHPRRQFGIFDPAVAAAAVAGGIRDYCEETLDADTFGLNIARQFRESLSAIEQAQLWFLWCIIEASGDDKFIYLFLLKHEESFQISAQGAVTSGQNIQPDKLQYAAKISLGEWQRAQTKTYLSFLAPKNQQPITLAWKALTGFSEGVDRAVQTEEFLNVLDQYAEALPQEKEVEYCSRIVDYCRDQDRAGAPVEIKALSRHVDEEEPEALFNFVTEHFDEAPPALYTDRKQMKRYTRFYGRDQDLSISFSTLMLGRHVIYDENTDALTIRAIPKALKTQLARHSKK